MLYNKINIMEEQYELAKWLAGEMSESELKAFEKTPEYATYAKIKTLSGQLEMPSFDERKMYDNILENKKSQGKTIPLYSRSWLRIAAVLILFLGLAFSIKSYLSSTEYTQNGQQSSFLLPDQSQVVLNSDSEIQYKKWSWNNNRRLLLDGEAYFKVAKGKTFVVATELGKVTVLGTQFNVKSRNKRLDVSCYEGRVRVRYNNIEAILTKGESIAFTNGIVIEVPRANKARPEWMDHELAFKKENLEKILNELSRQYDIELELKSPVPHQLFTGDLPMQNLNEALKILSATYHLQSIKTDKNKIILLSLDVKT